MEAKAYSDSERDAVHTEQLIQAGKVGFVQIPTDGHIQIANLSSELR